MYCTYFGFRYPPFRHFPRADPFFEGAQRATALETLMYAIEHGDGVLQVTAAPGSGCTTLGLVIQARLSGRILCAYLSEPVPTPRQAMRAIAQALGIANDALGDPAARVQSYLRANMKSGRQLVLLIDEAQRVPRPTLEAIRLLSNLDTSAQKAAQLVLLGTPELNGHLASHDIRPLRDRVTHKIELPPLSRSEVNDYLELRVRSAGGNSGLFVPHVAHAIGRASGGLPLHVNRLADRVLMVAFAEDTREVAMRHVRCALEELDVKPRGWLARLQRRLIARRRLAIPMPNGAR